MKADTSNYDANIAKAKKQLDDFGKNNLTAGGQIKQMTSTLVSSAAKFASFGAAAAAAMKVAKDAFFNNEESLDEWGRTVESVESIYKGFLNSLNTGDISGFLSNIQTITQAARDAYDALDELATFTAFNKANVAGARADLSGSIADYREGKGSKDAVSKASEALIKELETKQKLQEEAYKKVIAKVAAERGVKEADLMKVMTGNYGTFKELKDLQYTGKKTTMVATGGTFTSGPTYRQITEAVPANEREKLAQAIKHLNDTEIDNFQGLAESAKMTSVEINNQRKMVARVINGKQPGEGGKGGKSAKQKEEYIPLEGSIDAQTKKVQELQKAWRAAADDTSRADIKKQIEEAQLVLDAMNGKTKLKDITIKADTKDALEKVKAIDGVKVDDKTLTVTADTTEALAKIQKINNIKIQPKKLEIQVPKMSDIAPNGLFGKPRTMEDFNQGVVKIKQAVQMEIDEEASKVDTQTLKNLMKDSLQNGINGMDLQFGALSDKIAKGIDIPDTSWQGILDQYNDLRVQVGKDPIKIDFETGNISNVIEDINAIVKTARTTAHVVGSIGEAFNAIEDPAAKVAGTVMQAIATVALGYAQATLMSASMGPWAWIAFAATGLATMLTTVSAIHSATGYAEGGKVRGGGIIEGNSYSGDNIPIMANAGEIVLNRSMQANLASSLQGQGSGMHVIGQISGEKIVLVANRYFKRTGQGEIVTW
jgi:hypothetical protein